MIQTKQQPELIEHIGWDLWRATQVWKHRFNAEMIKRGFTWFGEARANLLPHISYRGIAQIELAHKAGMTKQAVQQHLDDLVKDGVIERIADPKDARRKQVHFTAKGLYTLAVANEVKQAIEEDYRRLIGSAAMDNLKQALTLIIASKK